MSLGNTGIYPDFYCDIGGDIYISTHTVFDSIAYFLTTVISLPWLLPFTMRPKATSVSFTFLS